MDLFKYFDRAVVINLPERRDRRRDMERQLRGAGISPKHRVEFFPGIRPSDRLDWASIGARGSFLSHYAVLREACSSGVQSIVVMEDDCDFPPYFTRLQEQVASELASRDWDMVYLGHGEATADGGNVRLVACEHAVTAHFYAIHGRVLRRLVDYLEAVNARPGGHPLGGPQFIDGAFAMFRSQNPDVLSLMPVPSLGKQRSSRSDVTPRWFDKVPVARWLIEELRRYQRS